MSSFLLFHFLSLDSSHFPRLSNMMSSAPTFKKVRLHDLGSEDIIPLHSHFYFQWPARRKTRLHNPFTLLFFFISFFISEAMNQWNVHNSMH